MFCLYHNNVQNVIADRGYLVDKFANSEILHCQEKYTTYISFFRKKIDISFV